MIQLNAEQEMAAADIMEWYHNARGKRGKYYALAGYAGTGKTTLLGRIVQLIHEQYPYCCIGFMAFTGKASTILHQKLTAINALGLFDYVGTIHSLIYRLIGIEEYDEDKNIGGDLIWDRKNNVPCNLLVVDEASMLTEEMFNDIIKFGLPVIFAGDPGQLPPVKGTPKQLLENPNMRLWEVHRQVADNPIIQIAHTIRRGEQAERKIYSPSVAWLKKQDKVCLRALNSFIENGAGCDEAIILCGRNSTRTRLNTRVRMALDCYGKDPKPGEKLVCLQNNKASGVMNGQFGKVLEIEDLDEFNYLLKIQMECQDHPLTTVAYKGAFGQQNYTAARRAVREDSDVKRALRYLSSLPGAETVSTGQGQVDLFDYGYAISVHKAQGSEWTRVVVFNEIVSKNTSAAQHRQWLYTAVTRSSERLLLIDPQ